MIKKEFTRDDTAVIKAIAILLLLFHHTFLFNPYISGASIVYAPFSQGLVQAVAALCRNCITVFAMLSGYGSYLTYARKQPEGLRQNAMYICRRMVHLMKNYWLLYAILLFLNCLRILGFSLNSGAFGTWQGILANFTGLAYLFHQPLACDPWWYMSFIVLFDLTYPLWHHLIDRLGIILTAAWFILISTNLLPEAFSDYYGILILSAVIGMICAKYDVFTRLKSDSHSSMVKIAVSLAVIGLAVLLRRFGLLSRSITAVMSFFVIYIPFECSHHQDSRLRRAMALLGNRHSQNIYLIHYLFVSTGIAAYLYSARYFLLIYMGVFLLSLLSSWLYLKLIKLIHYDRWTEGLLRYLENSGNARNFS